MRQPVRSIREGFHESSQSHRRSYGTRPSRRRTEPQLTAEHDDFGRRFGAVHRRMIRFEASVLIVEDRLIGAKGVALGTGFHLEPWHRGRDRGPPGTPDHAGRPKASPRRGIRRRLPA